MSHGSPQRTSPAGGSRRGSGRYRELECVRLRHDLPEHGLKRGEEGTIVHAFKSAASYLVEFVDPQDGTTRAEVELAAEDIAPVGGTR
jgi:hypothetical protein